MLFALNIEIHGKPKESVTYLVTVEKIIVQIETNDTIKRSQNGKKKNSMPSATELLWAGTAS